MRSLSLIIAALLPCVSIGQVLLIDPNGDPGELRFDPVFIQRNHLRTITGDASVKREAQPVRPKDEHYIYRFDANGRLIHHNAAYKRSWGSDSLAVDLLRDGNGNVLEERRTDVVGRFALRDSLDDHGRPLRRTHVRLTGEPPTLTEVIISDERYAYVQESDSVMRRTWFNERGLPYREQRTFHDAWGYQRRIEDRNLITGKRGSITFRYSEKGRLAERIEITDLASPNSLKHIWRYDQAGNVTLCDVHRNGVHTRHTEYLYEQGNLYLKAVISKDLETGLIHIVRFSASE